MTDSIHQNDAAATMELRALIEEIQTTKLPLGFVLAAHIVNKEVPIPMADIDVTSMGGYVVALAYTTYKTPVLQVFESAEQFMSKLCITRADND